MPCSHLSFHTPCTLRHRAHKITYLLNGQLSYKVCKIVSTPAEYNARQDISEVRHSKSYTHDTVEVYVRSQSQSNTENHGYELLPMELVFHEYLRVQVLHQSFHSYCYNNQSFHTFQIPFLFMCCTMMCINIMAMFVKTAFEHL